MNFCATAAFLGLNICDNQTATTAVEQSFVQHIADHGLSYGTVEEYNFRLGLFNAVDAEINEINANPENTFTVGHNFLSTMTMEEKKRMFDWNLTAKTIMSVDEWVIFFNEIDRTILSKIYLPYSNLLLVIKKLIDCNF